MELIYKFGGMMKLLSVTIEKYKSIEIEQAIDIQDDITILVGMNESGKTAILESIAKTNSLDEDLKFDTIHDYPRKEKKKMDKSGIIANAITCKYSINSTLKAEIEEELGEAVLLDDTFEVTTKYDNKKDWKPVSLDLDKFIKNKIQDESFYTDDLYTKLSKITTKEEIESLIESFDNDELKQKLLSIVKYYSNNLGWEDKLFLNEYITRIFFEPNLPKFLYYDEYYSLPSRISIEQLEKGALTAKEFKTAKALFELADINSTELIESDNFENVIAELEATSLSISKELFKYWKTNKNLEIAFKIDSIEKTNVHNNKQIVEHVLDIRVRSKGVSLPLTNRSKGFNWFFSFFVWFMRIQEDQSLKYILLLDEPGLNLHASAQKDLLSFIEVLSENYQVIYTTHSPFMIPELHLNRIRTVFESDQGTTVSDSIQEKDPNTLFPLQAALGYDIAQNLFISEKNLLVEGVSDMVFIQVISSLLESNGKKHLRADVTIVPTGGLDKVATFISLLRGNKLGIVCLLDTPNDAKGKARLDDMVKEKLIHENNIRYFHQFVDGYNHADVEDLFLKQDYLNIYNEAFKNGNHIKLKDLNDKIKPILFQINEHLNQKRFNHYLPAKILANSCSNCKISEITLNNFEKMFIEVNKLFD